MINNYAVIPTKLFSEEMLADNYPVVQRGEKWVIVEFNDENPPTSKDWELFKGKDSNKKCAEYLKNNS